MFIVDVKAPNREKFVRLLENKGLRVREGFTREEIIQSIFPITLDFEKKEIGRVGNVTCTCAALSKGLVMKEEEFLKKVDLWKTTQKAVGGDLHGTESPKIESGSASGEARRSIYQKWFETTDESNETRVLYYCG